MPADGPLVEPPEPVGLIVGLLGRGGIGPVAFVNGASMPPLSFWHPAKGTLQSKRLKLSKQIRRRIIISLKNIPRLQIRFGDEGLRSILSCADPRGTSCCRLGKPGFHLPPG